MATYSEFNTEADVGSLVAGIMQDARQLMVQQLTIFELEVKHDMKRLTAALASLIVGGAIALAALILLGLASAHLLVWVNPDLPLWGALAIVSIPIALAAGWLIYWSKAKLDQLAQMPNNSLAALKENIQWKTKN